MTQIILSVQYDWRLVALSIAVAVYASYIAFDLATRIARSQGRKEFLWTACCATVMGLGMWAAQCVLMLALVLPAKLAAFGGAYTYSVRYNVPIIALSLLIAITSCWVALFIVTRKESSEPYLIGGSLALGGGIAAMHYAAMAAMEFSAQKVYNTGFVALSVMVAVLASGVALQLARLHHSAKSPAPKSPAQETPAWMRWLGASVMAVAMGATHYSAMVGHLLPLRSIIGVRRPFSERVGSKHHWYCTANDDGISA